MLNKASSHAEHAEIFLNSPMRRAGRLLRTAPFRLSGPAAEALRGASARPPSPCPDAPSGT